MCFWRDATLNGIYFHWDRLRLQAMRPYKIGNMIRQLRNEIGIEARDLAKLVERDAANLSRIENDRYSLGGY